MPHKFRIGQTVRLAGGGRYVRRFTIGYKVVRQLPKTGGEHSYRIKSVGETLERVVNESELLEW